MNIRNLALTVLSSSFALAATSAKAVGSRACGQARADLKVCISGGAIPGGVMTEGMSLNYSSGEKYSFSSQATVSATQPNIVYHQATGFLRGAQTSLLLRVDNSTLSLPVWPPRASATLYYYNGLAWQIVPGTNSFAFITEF